MYVDRALDILKTLQSKSCFLFGPRQTGKTSLIKQCLHEYPYYNLLDSTVFLKLSNSPEKMRQELQGNETIVIIDEIQKLPHLLDEVQLMIETHGIRFLLTGSSPRKLRRGGCNLLGGRARSKHLHPFTYRELGETFDLERALNYGLIPSIYFSDEPREDLESYASLYVTEEIAAEGLTRNIPAFSRFLEVAALCNGSMINFTEIANDAQVPRTTVHEYFRILEDTLIASTLPVWQKTRTRKAVATDKYYFFDVGVVRSLQHRSDLNPRSPEWGEAFETYMFHELKAYADYCHAGPVHYWRSKSGYEVDFILGERVAIEVKARSTFKKSDIKGLKALREEGLLAQYVLVNCEETASVVDGIQILPWQEFLDRLWHGAL
jgi:uncharacterized protein